MVSVVAHENHDPDPPSLPKHFRLIPKFCRLTVLGSYGNLPTWQENITEESFLIAGPILHVTEIIRSAYIVSPIRAWIHQHRQRLRSRHKIQGLLERLPRRVGQAP